MTEIQGPPDDYVEAGRDHGMTNFDLTYTPDLDNVLRSGKVYVFHVAWEFRGTVWFEDGIFHEQVWRFGEPISHVTALTVKDLMEHVNETYGWD